MSETERAIAEMMQAAFVHFGGKGKTGATEIRRSKRLKKRDKQNATEITN